MVGRRNSKQWITLEKPPPPKYLTNAKDQRERKRMFGADSEVSGKLSNS